MFAKRRSDLTARAIDGEAVILDRVTGQVHRLNVTASCVWYRLDGATTTADVAAHVAATFARAPEHVLDDVRAAIDAFERLGLLESPPRTDAPDSD